MSAYRLTSTNTIVRTSDGACIPTDGGNTDYQRYLEWLALGNTPDPAPAPALTYQGAAPLLARVTTTNATPTEIFRSTLATNTGYRAQLSALGVDMGNGNMWERSGRFLLRRLSGAAQVVGTPIVDAPITDPALGWSVSAGVSGNDFVITVTGAAGRTIDWSLTGTYTSFTPNGR